MNLKINNKLEIPAKKINWRFSRSSGAGGQNLNKTESRDEIVFNGFQSKALTSYQKYRILFQKEVKIIDGSICIAVQVKRTQYQNRKLKIDY